MSNSEPVVRAVPIDQEVLAYSPKSIKESIDLCLTYSATYDTAKDQQLKEIEWLKSILTRRRELEDLGISVDDLKRGK